MKISVRRISIILTIAITWLGLFSNFISVNAGGIVLVAFEYVLLALIAYPGYLRVEPEKHNIYKSLLCFLLFLSIYLIGMQLFSPTSSFTDIAGFRLSTYSYNVIVNFPLWTAGFLLLIKCNDDDYNLVVNTIFIVLLYDIGITLITLFYIPNFARNSAAMITTTGMTFFRSLGAMGYELAFSMAILAPVMFAYGKKTNQKHWCLLGLMGGAVVLKSIFFLGIVALVLNIVLALVFGQKNIWLRRFLVIFLIATSLYLITHTTYLGALMINIGSEMADNDLQRRVIQVGYALAYSDNTGDSLVRFELYLRSLRGILEQPILGNLIFGKSDALSGHSTTLDIWSGLGIVPFIAFISSILYAYKFVASKIVDKSWEHIIIASAVTFFFIATVDPVLSGPNIVSVAFFIIPVMSSILSRKAKGSIEN